MPHLSVPLQICNNTVAMLYNFWDLAHLIKRHFCVWCGKCAKYLAFGTFTTPAVGALICSFFYHLFWLFGTFWLFTINWFSNNYATQSLNLFSKLSIIPVNFTIMLITQKFHFLKKTKLDFMFPSPYQLFEVISWI